MKKISKNMVFISIFLSGFLFAFFLTTSLNCVIIPESFKKATIYFDHFKIQVGSKDIQINNQQFELNAPILEIDGHSYVPLRFMLDWYGGENINYQGETEEITFTLKRWEKIDMNVFDKYAK